MPHAPRCCRWAPHLAAALSAPPVAAAAIFAIAAAGPAAAQPAACEALAGQAIPVAAIGLPTGGASLTEARRAPAGPSPVAGNAPLPAYCQVRGRIAPLDAAAPPILFQLNMPEDWNGKAV